MPKDPILDRTSYYVKRRGARPAGSRAIEHNDSTMYVDFDWNLVNTNLGAMAEPRQIAVTPMSGSGLSNLDLDEVAFNRRLEMPDNQTMFDACHGGLQLPADYNT